MITDSKCQAEYCWCGTRLTTDTDVLRMHCSAHGYQDRAYGPTPPPPTIPHG
jgi:hypothetical protein